MTLEEAIKHAEEVMMENLEKTKDRNASDPIAINCFECADEHRQLAEWLKELKAHREAWNKLQEEMDRLDPDYDSYSVKNNACLLVNKYRPKEGDVQEVQKHIKVIHLKR